MSKHADCQENKAESHFTNQGKRWSRPKGNSSKNREKGKVKPNKFFWTGETGREKTKQVTDVSSQSSMITSLTTLKSKGEIVFSF